MNSNLLRPCSQLCSVWCFRWEETEALAGAWYLILILETSWPAKGKNEQHIFSFWLTGLEINQNAQEPTTRDFDCIQTKTR